MMILLEGVTAYRQYPAWSIHGESVPHIGIDQDTMVAIGKPYELIDTAYMPGNVSSVDAPHVMITLSDCNGVIVSLAAIEQAISNYRKDNYSEGQ